MKKFKIGDRVRIVRNNRANAEYLDKQIGEEFTITEADGPGQRGWSGPENSHWWDEDELELVSAAPVTPSNAFAEVARSISIRQSATETAEQFVRRIWLAVELQRGVKP